MDTTKTEDACAYTPSDRLLRFIEGCHTYETTSTIFEELVAEVVSIPERGDRYSLAEVLSPSDIWHLGRGRITLNLGLALMRSWRPPGLAYATKASLQEELARAANFSSFTEFKRTRTVTYGCYRKSMHVGHRILNIRPRAGTTEEGRVDVSALEYARGREVDDDLLY